MSARPPGAVVIGGYINALGVVRALAARGVPTAVVTTRPFDIAHRSRYVSAHEALYDLDERPEGLVEVLDRRASDWRGWALLPTNDGAVTALSRHRDRLGPHHRVLAPPWEVARHLLDKQLTRDAARAVGAPLPRDYGAATREAVERLDLVFPLVVKPVMGHVFAARFNRKLVIVRDRGELQRAIALAEQAGIPCMLVDFIPGPDSLIHVSCFYVDRRGEPGPGVTIRKLRQNPVLCGVARAAEIAPHEPGLREIAIEIARRIGFRGIVAAEFKRDPRDATFRLIEVNGRSVLYNSLLRRAGLDLAGLAWSDAVDGRAEPPRPTHWPGVWVNLHADLLYAAFRRRDGESSLGELARTYRRPLLEAVWSARDPLPFFAQWSRTARMGIGGLLTGGHPRNATTASRQS